MRKGSEVEQLDIRNTYR